MFAIRSRSYLLSTTLILSLLAAPFAIAKSARKDDAGAYASGKYRNLFAETGHSNGEIKAKIEAAYKQLFHGDPITQATAFAAGSNANGPLMYVTDWGNHDVRTEGMSYGMMIAVQLGKKSDFDALWNWAKTYMYVGDPSHPAYGYFSWSCKTDGTSNEETPAPDGEEYFVMSLFFAGNRWPGGQGIYDYHAEAEQLLTTMRHRAIMTGPTKFGQRSLGSEVNEENAMILFVPQITAQPFTDPSYHLPAFYELWARWGPEDDRDFWQRAAGASRSFFSKAANPKTGLTPDYANFDGTPHVTSNPQSGEFAYDAWRTASNWAVDWSWWRGAPAEQELSDRIQEFFATQGVGNTAPVYTLDGQEVDAKTKQTHHDLRVGLVSVNAVAGLAAYNQGRAKLFTDALWNAPIPSGQDRYYDGMLYLMSLMHVGGQFRIWAPQ
jgi:oligosaccharide reducing-end xylanase